MPSNLNSENVSSSDQRYLPRWEVNNKVLYRTQNETNFKEARSKDISCVGACIAADESFKPNQNLTIKFYLAPEVAVYLEGQTVWSKALEEKKLTGIIFHNISDEAQELILQHAFHCDKEKLIRHWFKGW